MDQLSMRTFCACGALSLPVKLSPLQLFWKYGPNRGLGSLIFTPIIVERLLKSPKLATFWLFFCLKNWLPIGYLRLKNWLLSISKVWQPCCGPRPFPREVGRKCRAEKFFRTDSFHLFVVWALFESCVLVMSDAYDVVQKSSLKLKGVKAEGSGIAKKWVHPLSRLDHGNLSILFLTSKKWPRTVSRLGHH